MNDLEIYKKAALVLRTGENVALITVISTEGSTPGKVGYKMLVWGLLAPGPGPGVTLPTGGGANTLGTIGGGRVEAEVIDIAKRSLPKIENQVLRFSFDDEKRATEDTEFTEIEKYNTSSEFSVPSVAKKAGICGGVMELLVETFDQKSLHLFEELCAAIETGQKGALVSIISPKRVPQKVFLRDDEQFSIERGAWSVEPGACTLYAVRSMLRLWPEHPERRKLQGDAEIFIEPVLDEAMVFIFGAGHLSYHISRYAKSVDFQVTICDDRAEFANKNRFPDADNIVVERFETVFDRIEVNRNSYIVIVTRGHESDQMVLEKAVRTDAKYIGMIGSKKKTTTILKRLQEKGITREALRRIYSPIGISIGAVTPQEIALSIVCELTKIRRLGDAPTPNHMKVSR